MALTKVKGGVVDVGSLLEDEISLGGPLTPTAGWDAVPQLETETPTLGGPDGIMNKQAQRLLNRTQSLRNAMGSIAAYWAGAKGDGIAMDTSPLLVTLVNEAGIHGGKVELKSGSSYKIDRPYQGVQRGLPLAKGVSIDGNGANIYLSGNCDFFFLGRRRDWDDATNLSFYGVTPGVDYAQIVSDVASTSSSFTVANGDEAAFSAGDAVYVRLGQASYDSAEPDYFYYAKVVGTSPGLVQLDRPSGYAMSVAATSNPRQRRIIKVTDIPENQRIENLRLIGASSGAGNAEFGIHFRYAKNIDMRNISGSDVGAGLIGGQFGENISIDNVSIEQCSDRSQASKGRMFSFAECKGVTVNNYRAEKFDNVLAFIEGASEKIRFTNGVVVNNAPAHTSSEAIFYLAGGKDLLVDGLKLEGSPCPILAWSSGEKMRPPFLKNVEASESFAPAFSSITRWFDVDHVDENVKMGSWFNFSKKKRVTVEISILASQGFKQIALPFGVYTKITATITDKTGVTGVALAHASGANPVPSAGGAALISSISNGVPFVFPKTDAYPWWAFGSAHPLTNPAVQKYVYYQSNGSVTAGAKLYLEIEYFPAAAPQILADTLTHFATS